MASNGPAIIGAECLHRCSGYNPGRLYPHPSQVALSQEISKSTTGRASAPAIRQAL